MAEYWKSTPKYWCKHCKTFVRDTGLEKKNHEATARHQGNLQRFLRGLHKDNDREQREKQRAKDEADRLNGVVKNTVPSGGHTFTSSSRGPLTPADRKRQMQQLAEMGIAVPEDFRRETAMAGEWETVSRRVVADSEAGMAGFKKEEDEKDSKPVLNIGVRKRKHEGQEEEEEAGETVVKRGWGSKTRAFPGASANDDLEALLSKAKARDPQSGLPVDAAAVSSNTGPEIETTAAKDQLSPEKDAIPAGEEPSVEGADASKDRPQAEEATAKQEEEPTTTAVVFKKRKAKPTRPRD